MVWRILTVAAVTVVLLLGSTLVFQAFDSHSHSVSDTLRPFIITMAPVWFIEIWAATVLLRARPPGSRRSSSVLPPSR